MLKQPLFDNPTYILLRGRLAALPRYTHVELAAEFIGHPASLGKIAHHAWRDNDQQLSLVDFVLLLAEQIAENRDIA